MGTMAASAAGSVAGSYIGQKMFGGSSSGQEGQPAPQAQQQQQQQQLQQQQPLPNDPCAAQFQAFSKCIEVGGTNESCKWAWDMVTSCRTQHGI